MLAYGPLLGFMNYLRLPIVVDRVGVLLRRVLILVPGIRNHQVMSSMHQDEGIHSLYPIG